MSVNKSYDLTGGKVQPPKGFSELLTGDPFRYAYEIKLQRRQSAMDIS